MSKKTVNRLNQRQNTAMIVKIFDVKTDYALRPATSALVHYIDPTIRPWPILE